MGTSAYEGPYIAFRVQGLGFRETGGGVNSRDVELQVLLEGDPGKEAALLRFGV